MTDEPLADLTAVLAAARGDDAAAALAGLDRVRALRAALDTAERSLVAVARAGGTSWSGVAAALGVTSRQAAEQRYLRLAGEASRDPAAARASRQRQRSVDEFNGPPIAALRGAVRALLRRVESDGAWEGRFPRATLARHTLTLAADAPPGALFALATRAADDLAGAALPAAVAAATADLAAALALSDPHSTMP